MSERVHSLTVVLDHDYHEDDVKAQMSAIAMIKGVIGVHPHVVDTASMMAEERARHELGTKLLETIYPKLKTKNDEKSK